MKKLFALILSLALLVSAAGITALAEEGKTEGGSKAWPVIELKGTAVDLPTYGNDKSFRHQTFSGPGRDYSHSGAFYPRSVVAAAINRENGYALLDLDYSGGRRCVYLPERILGSAEVAEITLTPVPARTNATISPMFYGPGIQYDEVRQRTRSKYADMDMEELMEIFKGDLKKIARALEDVYPLVDLVAGTRVNVLFEVNGWVCVETDCTVLGKARTWIPADQVTAE